MPSCSVPGCNNRSEKDRVRGVSFHSLPVKKPLVAEQWLDQIRRERFGLPKPQNVYVCSEHFTQNCFETEYRFQLLGGNTRIRSLKTGSVPTIFKWAPAKVRDFSEVEQERKEVLKSLLGQKSFTDATLNKVMEVDYDEVEHDSTNVTSKEVEEVVPISQVPSSTVRILEATQYTIAEELRVLIDVGTQTEPSVCSPNIVYITVSPGTMRKLVEQDHTYCKKKLKFGPVQP